LRAAAETAHWAVLDTRTIPRISRLGKRIPLTISIPCLTRCAPWTSNA